MNNALMVPVTVQDMTTMANAVAKSNLFGMKTPEQALALMLIAQSENLHPAAAIMTFDIIQGKPVMKSSAMLARFQAAGGKVDWSERSDMRVAAVFSHPQGGRIEVDWDIERAKKAGLAGKDNWQKYSRAMLSARCVSEGVRAVYPGALGGFYAPEEVTEMRDVTPPKSGNAERQPANRPPHDPATGEIFPPSDDVRPAPVDEHAAPAQTDESLRAEKFCNEAIARIDECDSAEKIEGWLAMNKTKLDRANAANPEAYDAVIAAAGYRKRKILGAAA